MSPITLPQANDLVQRVPKLVMKALTEDMEETGDGGAFEGWLDRDTLNFKRWCDDVSTVLRVK